MSDIFKFLNQAIKENVQREEDIKLTDNLRDDLGLDSLGILALADQLEEEFDIALEAEDLANNPSTVQAFVSLIERKRNESND